MITLFIALGAAISSPSGIPTEFQGDWRVSQTECPPSMTDRPVWINADRIRMDHAIGEVRVIEANGERDVTIAGELLSEGDPRNAKLRLQLSDTKRELVISEGDWSVTLQRCPNQKAAN